MPRKQESGSDSVHSVHSVQEEVACTSAPPPPIEAPKERAGKKPCSPELLEQLARMRETARKNLLARKQLAQQEAGKAKQHHVYGVSKDAASDLESDCSASSEDTPPPAKAKAKSPSDTKSSRREAKYENKYRMLRLEHKMVQLFNEHRGRAAKPESPKKEDASEVTKVAKESIRRRVNDEVLREAFSNIFGNR